MPEKFTNRKVAVGLLLDFMALVSFHFLIEVTGFMPDTLSV